MKINLNTKTARTPIVPLKDIPNGTMVVCINKTSKDEISPLYVLLENVFLSPSGVTHRRAYYYPANGAYPIYSTVEESANWEFIPVYELSIDELEW